MAERRRCPDLRVEERRAAKVGGGQSEAWEVSSGLFLSVPVSTWERQEMRTQKDQMHRKKMAAVTASVL